MQQASNKSDVSATRYGEKRTGVCVQRVSKIVTHVQSLTTEGVVRRSKNLMPSRPRPTGVYLRLRSGSFSSIDEIATPFLASPGSTPRDYG